MLPGIETLRKVLIGATTVASAVALLTACAPDLPPEPLQEPQDEQSIQHGAQLVVGLAACGYCHGAISDPRAPLSGGRFQSDKYGPVQAGNLTPSTMGIQDWSTFEIVQAIRLGVGQNDRQLSTEMHSGYEWMSDRDALAIVAYLRTLAPINQSTVKREVGFVERNTVGLMERKREVVGYIPAINPRYAMQYGQYLVDHVARCSSCHSKPDTLLTDEAYLDGGAVIRTVQGERMAPNITGSKVYGIGDWNVTEIVHYLKRGERPDRSVVENVYCPTQFYANALPSDLRAIAQYLLAVVPE